MTEDLKNIEQIEKYLHGEMNEHEIGTFENNLKTDKNLASETDLMRHLIKGIRKGGEFDLEKTISGVRTKLKNEGFFEQKEATIRPMKSSRNWLSYAAAIVVLIASTWFYFDWKYQQNIQMAMNSIEVEKMPELENILDGIYSASYVDDDRARKDNLMIINDLSKEGSIEEIKNAYEKHFEIYPIDLTAKLLYGNELLNKNLPVEAINQLKSLSNNEEFQYQNLARLTLAKAHLTLGDKENVKAAKSLLSTLSLMVESGYSDIAKQILETMNDKL